MKKPCRIEANMNSPENWRSHEWPPPMGVDRAAGLIR
jgi:hypothetical protein